MYILLIYWNAFHTELMNRLIDNKPGYEALICQLPVFHRNNFFSPSSHDILCIYIRKHEVENPDNLNTLTAWISLEGKKWGKNKDAFSLFSFGRKSDTTWS